MNFEEQLNKTRPLIQLLSKRFSKATNMPVEEYESALYEEFGNKAKKYNGSIRFSAYIKPLLTKRALNLADSNRRDRQFYERIIYAEAITDEDGNPTFEFESSINVEKEVVDPIKKCEDKLQLIHALLESADELTTAIANRMLEKPNASLNSIASEMGVHHEIVKRRLKRLAKNYDQSRFGDIAQYLAS